MNMFIIGGANFIGSNLVRQILDVMSHWFVNIDRLTYAGNLSSLGDHLQNECHTSSQVDFCGPSSLRALYEKHQPDAVMHLAADSHMDCSTD